MPVARHQMPPGAAAHVRLSGIAWDDERCLAPLRAASEYWLKSTGVEVSWTVRSLLAFGDQPIEDLAEKFDLLVIDHPFVGVAHELGCLVPLETVLGEATLEDLAADAIGETHDSYVYGGRLWAAATDAACQVSAVRDDLIGTHKVPATWDGVVELAEAFPGQVTAPLRPADAISSFLSLCATKGAPVKPDSASITDRDIGCWALAMLGRLAAGHAESSVLDPVAAFDRMTSTDEIAYMPLVYGYARYGDPKKVERPVRFGPAPRDRAHRAAALLGGSGVAVSACSTHQSDGAAFAAWLGGPEAQREVVAVAGGQPTSRAAWAAAALLNPSGGFFEATLRTLEQACVRPRASWWPRFQLAAGRLLTGALIERRKPGETFDALQRVWWDTTELARAGSHDSRSRRLGSYAKN